ncbi:zinc finger domain-containing protein [Actinoplanes sp. CA-252034]
MHCPDCSASAGASCRKANGSIRVANHMAHVNAYQSS